MQINNFSRLKKLPILFDDLSITALSDNKQNLISAVDACLPQTQCGLCEYSEGCLPYAHAIVIKGEAINKCVPGGQPVVDKIAKILNQPTQEPSLSKWDIDILTGRPQEVRAIIREDDCIGCTKCIPACPVDAIIGTGKHMHTVITELCTGCELCLAPCPVDCIDLNPIQRDINAKQRENEQNHLRNRYHTHLNRVAEQIQDKRNAKPVISVVQSKLSNSANSSVDINASKAKHTIAAAKIRTKIKKLEKQLAVREHQDKRDELESLKTQLANLTIV